MRPTRFRGSAPSGAAFSGVPDLETMDRAFDAADYAMYRALPYTFSVAPFDMGMSWWITTSFLAARWAQKAMGPVMGVAAGRR